MAKKVQKLTPASSNKDVERALLKEIASKVPNEVLFTEKVSQAKEYIKGVKLTPILKPQ